MRAARLTADVLTVTSGGSTFTLVRTPTVIIGACTSSTVRSFGAKMNQDSRDSDDDIVITPGGPMPRSSTHRVRPGGEVRQEADGSYTVIGPLADPSIQRSTAMSDNVVLTPGGYRDVALVHHVAGDTVIDSGQGRLRQLSLTGAVLADHGRCSYARPGGPSCP